MTFLCKFGHFWDSYFFKLNSYEGMKPSIKLCAHGGALSKKKKLAQSVCIVTQIYLEKMADVNFSEIWNISTKNLTYESNQTVLQNRVQPNKISWKFCTSNLTFESHVPSNRFHKKTDLNDLLLQWQSKPCVQKNGFSNQRFS